MTIVARNRTPILLHKLARELGHHKPRNLLARSVFIEVGGMAIGAFHPKGFCESGHHLRQALSWMVSRGADRLAVSDAGGNPIGAIHLADLIGR